MLRTFSTRRFTIAYALVVALLVALGANLLHFFHLQRQERQIQHRLESLQHILVSTYREIPADRFLPWLDHVDFRAGASPGWNVVWLAPDLSVRWSIKPVDPNEWPSGISDAIRALNASEHAAIHHLCIREGGRRQLIDLHRLSPDDPAAGYLLLCAPLPRFFSDANDLWIAAALLFVLLVAIFVFYQQLLLRHIRHFAKTSGLSEAIPSIGQPIETWAKQHITLASRRISEEHDHFDALFDILQDGTLVLDADNRIVRANTTALHLLAGPSKTLVGSHLSELADGGALADLVGEIRAARAYRAAEIPLQDGAALCNAAGIPLQEGSETGRIHVMLALRDISHIRQLERAGEEYATNVSHELKTPLTLILGYTETLLSHAEMDPEFRDRSLRTIEHHAKRILRIIDDLLRLAWLKNERETIGNIPRAPVPVASVVGETVASCREWARNAGIAVETHIPDGLVWNLNAGLMEEALGNLVKNAILYALVGPVDIRARILENGNLELAVIDRGPGLKPEDAKHIFDRFYRADKGRSRASGGSGLGLPIVQQIVEAHHGAARVETAPGEGCTFILEIPPGG